MRTRSALTVAVTVGFSLLGCSDEAPGPGVGPDTSWQIYCSKDDPDDSCGTSEQPHGPLDGLDREDDSDDYKLEVSCEKTGSGLSITIEDPGRKENVSKKLAERPRSVINLSRAKPAANTCFLSVTEYPLSGGQRVLKDTCEGTVGSTQEPGTCTLTGEEDSNGYAFEGTLICEGMRINGSGPAAWTLRGARQANEPVVLQIANCN
jgi:hypothetical protein